MVAVPNKDPEGEPIIIELKTSFTLSLFHQAINRQSMTDQVYIAVPRKTGKAAMVAIRRNKMLCRRSRLSRRAKSKSAKRNFCPNLNRATVIRIWAV